MVCSGWSPGLTSQQTASVSSHEGGTPVLWDASRAAGDDVHPPRWPRFPHQACGALQRVDHHHDHHRYPHGRLTLSIAHCSRPPGRPKHCEPAILFVPARIIRVCCVWGGSQWGRPRLDGRPIRIAGSARWRVARHHLSSWALASSFAFARKSPRQTEPILHVLGLVQPWRVNTQLTMEFAVGMLSTILWAAAA